jgi:hypothetical protein
MVHRITVYVCVQRIKVYVYVQRRRNRARRTRCSSTPCACSAGNNWTAHSRSAARGCLSTPSTASRTYARPAAHEDKAAGADERTTINGAPRLSIPSRAGWIVSRATRIPSSIPYPAPTPAFVAQAARASAIAHRHEERRSDADARRERAGHERRQEEGREDQGRMRVGGAVKAHSSSSVCAITRSAQREQNYDRAGRLNDHARHAERASSLEHACVHELRDIWVQHISITGRTSMRKRGRAQDVDGEKRSDEDHSYKALDGLAGREMSRGP